MSAEILVVVTAHNYARFLPRCLDSVLAQEGDVDWELALVDDGSSDETPLIAADYAARSPRIHPLRLEGRGLAGAANAGIRSRQSEWVLRLDADDWLHPACLRTLLDAVEKQGVDLAYPDFYLTDEQGLVIARENRAPLLSGPGHERSPLAAACLYRRTVWEELGGYDETLRYQEDFDFWLKFIERYAWTHVPEPLLYYRQHGISMSTNKLPRAMTRQNVKHAAVARQGKVPADGSVPVYISTLSSLSQRIPPGTALRAAGGKTLMQRLADRVAQCAYCGSVTVITAEQEVACWAEEKGWKSILSESHFHAGADPFTEAVRHVASDGVCLMVSPYWPLIEPWRMREAVDTLLLFGCGVVDTVVAEPSEVLVLSGSGAVAAPGTDGENQWVSYRLAGGVRALCNGGDRTKGVVEILLPENMSFSGEIERLCIERLLDGQ